MNNTTINNNSAVTLNFGLYLDDGQLVDGNIDTEAATFTMGDGTLLPGFEINLLGLKAGDEASYTIEPVNGFGAVNPNNVQLFSRGQFSGMVLELGTVVSFSDAAKAELPGVVKSIEGDQIEVDFNHPLAGKTLRFDVKIKEVS